MTMSKTTPPDPFGAISITPPDPPASAGRKTDSSMRPPPAPPFSRKAPPSKSKRSFSLSLVLTLLGVVFTLYLACGAFVLPYLIKSVLTQSLIRRLDRPVTIGQATFNPLTLRLTLTNGIVGPRLSDPADKVDPILSFSSLTVDLESLSLVRGAVICQELTLNQPFLHLVHDRQNLYNLTTLLPDMGQDVRRL